MVTRVFTSVLTTEDEITSFESRFRRLSAMKDWRRGLIVLRCCSARWKTGDAGWLSCDVSFLTVRRMAGRL